MRPLKKVICFSFLLSCFMTVSAQQKAPLFPPAYSPLLHAIYNQSFDQADTLFQELNQQAPSDPALLLLQTYQWKWQYLPIQHQTDSLQDRYIEKLKQIMEQTAKSKGDRIAFLHMVSQLFLAEFYYNSKSYLKAFQYGSAAYGEMKTFIKDDPKTGAELFMTGMYDYYRQYYEESNGLYATMLFFFPSGDKAKGLDFLKACLGQSTYFQTEALSYLTHIYLHIENKPQLALNYAQDLISQYPQNTAFQEMYAEVCLSLHKPQQAQSAISVLLSSNRESDREKGKILALIAQEQNPNQPRVRILAEYNTLYTNLSQQKQPAQTQISLVAAGMARCYQALENPEKAANFKEITLEHRKYDYPLTNF